MRRFVSGGVRIAAILMALAAMPAIGQDSSASSAALPDSTLPEELQGMVGDWALAQEDETLPTCPLQLTDTAATGGWAVTIADACPTPYPPAAQIAAWNVDDADGSVLLLDAEGHVTLRLMEDEDGLYDTDPDAPPQFFLLAPYDQDGAGGEADSD